MLNASFNVMWHGLALIGALALGLRLTRAASAATRHALWWAALIVVVADTLVELIAAAGAATHAAGAIVVPLPANTIHWLGAAVWLAGAIVLLAATAVGCLRVSALKRRSHHMAPAYWHRLPHLARMRRDATRRARVRWSIDLPAAALLGGRRPVIAVAPLLAERVSDEDLDRVLVHEQSHVERRDDWLALIERVVAAVFWWHPAVWVIGARIRFEREAACDARVVACAGDARDYAACLVRVSAAAAGRRAVSALTPAIGASELRLRVERLLAIGAVMPAVRANRAALGGVASALVAVMAGLASISIEVLAPLHEPGFIAAAEAAVMPSAPASQTSPNYVKRARRLAPAPVQLPDGVAGVVASVPRVSATTPADPAPTLPIGAGFDTAWLPSVSGGFISLAPPPVTDGGGGPQAPIAEAPATRPAPADPKIGHGHVPVIAIPAVATAGAFKQAGVSTAGAFTQAGKGTAGFFKRLSVSIAHGFSGK